MNQETIGVIGKVTLPKEEETTPEPETTTEPEVVE